MNWNFHTTYLNLPKDFYSLGLPESCPNPQLILLNRKLGNDLGLLPCDETSLAEVLCGQKIPEGVHPFSQAYAGHQFGHFTQLGDGRAHILGEHLCPQERRWDVQFKGSGPTVYSRRGDGRATVGPMLREYLISEALHHLGIPTTRSLAVTMTGHTVWRGEVLPGAILTRIAASHIRVGTFEYAASLNDISLLKAFVYYVIQRHEPDLLTASNPIESLLRRICDRQAHLMTDWMGVGFIHGVMNTDNMSICGESLDFGPCAFLNEFNLQKVFSSIDQRARYSFGRQPEIAQWNLSRLAETLLPLLHPDELESIEMARSILKSFGALFENLWRKRLNQKLGLVYGSNPLDKNSEFKVLSDSLIKILQEVQPDFTNTFYNLTLRAAGRPWSFETPLEADPRFQTWLQEWWKVIQQLQGQGINPSSVMEKFNPVVIPRNHLVEEVLHAAVKDQNMQPFLELCEVLKHPFTLEPVDERFLRPPDSSWNEYQTFCGT